MARRKLHRRENHRIRVVTDIIIIIIVVVRIYDQRREIVGVGLNQVTERHDYLIHMRDWEREAIWVCIIISND